MTSARYGHSATLLADGTVLIAGGKNINGSVINSVELFSPSTSVFAALSPMVYTRFRHSATRLADGTSVFFAGGLDNTLNNPPQNTTEMYTVAGGAAAFGNMVDKRCGHAATLLASGSILLCGGQTTTSYWDVTNSCDLLHRFGLGTPPPWVVSRTGSMIQKRSGLTMDLTWQVIGINQYQQATALGGWTGSTAASSWELYSEQAGTWSEITSPVPTSPLSVAISTAR